MFSSIPKEYTFRPDIIESSFSSKIKQAAYNYLDVHYSILYVPRMYMDISDYTIYCSYDIIDGLLPIYGFYCRELVSILVSLLSFRSEDLLSEEKRIKILLHELYHLYQYQKLGITPTVNFASFNDYRYSSFEIDANKFAYSFYKEFVSSNGQIPDHLSDPGVITIEDLLNTGDDEC
jgi:hypothetical protein